MLEITVKNKDELLKNFNEAEKLFKELSSLFWKMRIIGEISEPPEETDGCGESE